MSDHPIGNHYDDDDDWSNATTGGLIDNYVATVTGSTFDVDPEYRNGEVLRLIWDLTLVEQPDPDIDLGPGDTVREAFNVGNIDTWEALDGGAAAGRVDGKRARFNNSTAIGRLIDAVGKRAHYGDDEKTRLENSEELLDVLRQRGRTTTAAPWEGLTFQFRRLRFSFTSKDGEEVEYGQTFPVAFIPEGAEGKAGNSGGNANAASNGKAADATVTREALLELAKGAANHGAFLAAAMSTYPGVEDGEFSAEIIDKNGIFAEANA